MVNRTLSPPVRRGERGAGLRVGYRRGRRPWSRQPNAAPPLGAKREAAASPAARNGMGTDATSTGWGARAGPGRPRRRRTHLFGAVLALHLRSRRRSPALALLPSAPRRRGCGTGAERGRQVSPRAQAAVAASPAARLPSLPPSRPRRPLLPCPPPAALIAPAGRAPQPCHPAASTAPGAGAAPPRPSRAPRLAGL